MQETKSHASIKSAKALANMLVEAARHHSLVRNRRGQDRHPYSIPIRIGQGDDHGTFHTVAEVCSTDISPTGLGMLSKVEIPVGNVLWLEFNSGTREAWRIQVRIVYCRPLIGDVFRLGAEFITP